MSLCPLLRRSSQLTGCLVLAGGSQHLGLGRLLGQHRRTVFASGTLTRKVIDDSTPVHYIDAHDEKHDMTYGEVRSLAATLLEEKHRTMVRIFSGSRNQDKIPEFKAMTPTELEAAVRKARHQHSGVIHEIVQISDEDASSGSPARSGRIKEKQLLLHTRMTERDMEVGVKRIRKWLQANKLVRVTIKSGAGKHEAEEMAAKLRQACGEELKNKENFFFLTIH